MSDVKAGLEEAHAKIMTALAAVHADRGASQILAAVVDEWRKKSQRTLESLDGSSDGQVREGVVEIEQAADSAKAAAERDSGAKSDTRRLVIEAHDFIRDLKQSM